MIGRVAMTLFLAVECAAAPSLGQGGSGNPPIPRRAENPVVVDLEKQIEAVVAQDSQEATRLEIRKILEMVRQQFDVLDLSRSMAQRARAFGIYKVLQTSRNVQMGIDFEVFSGKPHGFLAFRVGDRIFLSSEFSRLPDPVAEGVVAHELSHDSRDYKRKLLIEANDLDDNLRQALNARIEARADERAVRLLAEANRDPGAVTVYLETIRKSGAVKEQEAQVRLAVAQAAEHSLSAR